MKKVLISTLLIISMILISTFCVSSADGYDLSLLENCRYLYTDNNSSGSYIYGYNQNTLYSAKLLPDVSIRYVSYNGFVRSACHNGVNCYALFEIDIRNNKYVLVEMNTDSGKCNYYTFTDMTSFNNSSFAVSDNEVFFMHTDSDYTYVRSYSFKGVKICDYKFDNEVSNLFVNNSNVYARLYNGDVYKLTGGNYSLCASTKSQSKICNAGKGYLYTDYGKIIALKDNKLFTGINSPLNCAVYDKRLYTANGNTVSSDKEYYTFDDDVLMLLVNEDKVAVLLKDYSCEVIKTSEMKDCISGFTINQTKIPYIVKDDVIYGVDSGTTVSQFKNAFAENISIYNNNGEKITSGLIKTGYRTVVWGKTYFISVKGDVTGEGNVKSNDVSTLMSVFTKKTQLSGVYYQSADYDLNGEVNNLDLVLIAQKYETEK